MTNIVALGSAAHYFVTTTLKQIHCLSLLQEMDLQLTPFLNLKISRYEKDIFTFDCIAHSVGHCRMQENV
jgi:hypothetical protein